MARRRTGGEAQAYWQALIEKCSASGLTQVDFCRRRGVALQTFRWWKHRLRRRGEGGRKAGRTEGGAGAGFVPVRVVSSSAIGSGTAGAPVEVLLRSGHVVRLKAGFDAEVLARAISVLESLPC